MNRLQEAIGAQGQILDAVLERDLDQALTTIDGKRVFLVGTGTSQHAAELGAQMLRLAGIDATWYSAATFARGRTPLPRNAAIVLITHTGETAFAHAVRANSLRDQVPLIALTGDAVDWLEAIAVAPRERSETYTQSYTAVLLVLARLAGELGAAEFGPQALARTISAARSAQGRDWGAVRAPERLLVIAGSGPAAITAREGALKVREAASLPSEGFESEYLLHGSAVPLGERDRLLLLEPASDPDGLTAELGAAARAEGVEVDELDRADAALDPLLAQIPLTIRLQLLAAVLAEGEGKDPDTVIKGAWAGDRLWTAGAQAEDGGPG